MPHIALPEDMPGITAGFAFRPETAKPMRELAHVLLHTSGNDGFSSADRELVAAFVSSRNTCYFCQTSHGAAAAHLHECDYCPWGYFGNESSVVDFYTFAALHIEIPRMGRGVRKLKQKSAQGNPKTKASVRKRKVKPK